MKHEKRELLKDNQNFSNKILEFEENLKNMGK